MALSNATEFVDTLIGLAEVDITLNPFVRDVFTFKSLLLGHKWFSTTTQSTTVQVW